MATLNGWAFFGRGKPKPHRAAVSPKVKVTLDEAFKGKVEPSTVLRDDYKRYLEVRHRNAG